MMFDNIAMANEERRKREEKLSRENRHLKRNMAIFIVLTRAVFNELGKSNCPVCGGIFNYEHLPDCSLGALERALVKLENKK
jgi:hypothetical protein